MFNWYFQQWEILWNCCSSVFEGLSLFRCTVTGLVLFTKSMASIFWEYSEWKNTYQKMTRVRIKMGKTIKSKCLAWLGLLLIQEKARGRCQPCTRHKKGIDAAIVGIAEWNQVVLGGSGFKRLSQHVLPGCRGKSQAFKLRSQLSHSHGQHATQGMAGHQELTPASFF